ncbi:FG-GAP repeat domain-containing protein [Granulosicoccus antarcticus]|uniref:FG-GAP repeat protein n=1 Tax=Granulosicoccus antarcticus IMCC3135 TaxID=1192854 RepID=A0A2Z2NV24_9GAMM|nr:hypothetical protein IMCC3135_18960 [Granulosicoccus antarcticus IMCC3135]
MRRAGTCLILYSLLSPPVLAQAGSFAVDSCEAVVAADVNNDGKTDLLCPYDYGNAKTRTFVQLSGGTTSSAWTPWSPDHGAGSFAVGSCRDIVAGDVNGDGKTDLLCPYDYGNAKTRTFVQLSGGTTSSAWTPWSPDHGAGSFAVGSCRDIVAGDVNGDGKTDLLCPYDYGNAKTRTFVQLSGGSTSSEWTPWSPDHGAGSFAVVYDAQYPRIVAGELVHYKTTLLITSVQGSRLVCYRSSDSRDTDSIN